MTAQLRAVLDQAADSQPPTGLAARAVGEASRRRRRRVMVSGSLLAVAVIFGGLAALRPVSADPALDPTDVATVPLELPRPEGVPTLAEAPMDAASAAYVVGGQLVLVSADDGHAALAVPPGWDGVDGAGSVALSPDGRRAVVVGAGSAAPDGLPLALIDVATGQTTALSGIRAARPGDGTRLWPQLVTWSPDSQWFACACVTASGRPLVRLVKRADAQDGTADGSSGWDGATSGLSWGVNGLAVRDGGADGLWRLAPTYQLPGGHGGGPGWMELGGAPAAVMAGQDNRHFLTGGGSRYIVWSGYGQPEHGSLGADRMVMVGDAVQGFLIGTRPASGMDLGPAAPVRVRWLSYFNESRDLTQLPPATTSASFAATLVGDPSAAGAP